MDLEGLWQVSEEQPLSDLKVSILNPLKLKPLSSCRMVVSSKRLLLIC